MLSISLKKTEPTVVQHNDWKKLKNGSFRCGNVLLRCDEVDLQGGYPFQRWNIYLVGPRGKLTRVHPKSRPWSYGRSGQAKIGASRLFKPVETPVASPTGKRTPARPRSSP